ncbi:MAG: Crp/Fnr family transcriptional regulator [Verrucomicrobiota bacterium]|nr:Crp/Fnr family transcriptional regulator [Limisphaera sp.]MDW8381414.1 Crp/Fnr family transcriptional regulator [Verrucomicrobiota bacterium]
MRQTFEELKRTALLAALRKTRLFGGLPPEDVASVVSITEVRPLKKGEYLFRQGEPARGFYVVQRGAVCVSRSAPVGREHVIRVFRAGESFAEAALMSPGGYPADARAVEPSQVLLVKKEGFLALLRSHPELGLRMLASMSLHLRTLVEQLEDLTTKDVETRLVHWLLKRCPTDHDGPVMIQLDVTKRVLASELGTVSETLSRMFGRFRQAALAKVQGRTIIIPSPCKLREFLKERLGESTFAASAGGSSLRNLPPCAG